jgi:uncharacterized membrane protein
MFPLFHRCLRPALAVAPLVFSLSGFADDYQAIHLTHCAGVPVAWLSPNGIAADNTIVGSFGDNQKRTRGFIYRDDQCTLIEFPGAFSTEAKGINASLSVVGSYEVLLEVVNNVPITESHGFLLKGGKWTVIDYPGERARDTVLNGINKRGDIVGTFYQGYNAYGFIRDTTGKFTEITANAFGTHALGINNAGVVVGYYRTTHVRADIHGFIYENGRLETVDHPKGKNATWFTGINSDDEIIGYYAIDDRLVGFLLSEDSFNPLRFPGPNGRLTVPLGINRSGYVVGQYGPSYQPGTSPDWLTRGFFWTWE